MADKAEPVWEWVFDRETWPHKSFFGRRWVEFHDGVEAEPRDGCTYFWICVLATIAWMFRGALFVAVPVFNVLFFPFVLMGRSVRRVAPSVADYFEEVGEFVGAAYGPTFKAGGKATGTGIGRLLRLLGVYMLHPVFLGCYSPLRLLGRGLLA